MRVTVCAVGRLKPGPERDLIDKFSKRIVWPFEIREVEERRKLSPPELARREAELLESACPPGAVRFRDLGKMLRHCRDLPAGPAAGDHHKVSDGGFAGKIDHHDVFGLVIFQRGFHFGEQGIGHVRL